MATAHTVLCREISGVKNKVKQPAKVLPFARVGFPRRAVGSGSGARAAPYVARRVRVPKGYGRTWLKRSGYASSRPAHVAARRDGAAGGSSEGRFA